MRQRDAASIDWASLIEAAVPASPAARLAVVGCVERAGVLELTFHGSGDLSAELFGVRIPVPQAIGDEWWQAAVGPNPYDATSTADPDDWARLVAVTEVMEPYDMMNPVAPPEPDANGVRWLYQFP